MLLVLFFGAIAIAGAFLSWRKPLVGLTALILLLPLHSGFIHLLENVLWLDPLVVTAAGSWKEGVLVGLTGAALSKWLKHPAMPRLEYVLALSLLGLIAIRGAMDLASGAPPDRTLYGGRALGEFLVVFLTVGIISPGQDWLSTTSRRLVPVVALVAAFAIVQPALGGSFYDRFFHLPGETLSSSYQAAWMGEARLRSAGTYESPNELGLALVITLLAVVGPLLLVRPSRFTALVWGLASAALVFSISRSAWVGGALGLMTVSVVGWPVFRERLGSHLRRLVSPPYIAPAGIPLVLAAALFLGTGGFEYVASTVTGEDPSAGARPESIAVGTASMAEHPLGLGLGTAGPKALPFNPAAVQTENWYLLYGIQLGWAPFMVLLVFLLVVGYRVYGRAKWWIAECLAVRSPQDGVLHGALMHLGILGSLVAALFGGLVIPAMLDLPTTMMLWAFVAAAMAGAQNPTRAGEGALIRQPR